MLEGTWQAVRIASDGNPVPAEIVRKLNECERVTLLEEDVPAGVGESSCTQVATHQFPPQGQSYSIPHESKEKGRI
jgi:hypothetical protein